MSNRALQRETLLIIPTHSHPETLPLVIESAQNQTEEDVGIVVIGDGVTDDTRDAIAPIVASDDRVAFIDKPKSVRRGEEYRDEVIRASIATRISYVCDDDLLFPHHIETLANLLRGVDFVNTLPIFINTDDSLMHMVSDLANPESVDWHLNPEVRRNTVSLTGVMHSRDSYYALPFGWRPAPIGRWTDHYMWEQFFSMPNFAGRTSRIATTAKFSQTDRDSMTGAERQAELAEFARKMATPGFVDLWNERVRTCERETLVRLALDNSVLAERRAELEHVVDNLMHQLADARSESAELQNSLNGIVASRSWRITAPLRKLRER